jgi:hypothetical protein
MKKVNPMKHKVLLGLMLVAPMALAQAPAAKPAAEAPKPAAATPAPAAAPAPAVAAEAPKPVRKTRRNEDARKCLDEPNNNAIIKCAEAYL